MYQHDNAGNMYDLGRFIRTVLQNDTMVRLYANGQTNSTCSRRSELHMRCGPGEGIISATLPLSGRTVADPLIWLYWLIVALTLGVGEETRSERANTDP